ncbi:hypothetical protein ACIQMV_08610 [Streptomyces sp. NPDC091412]|uniref:hypothetical protein n=1 Tax=Streptomyces sp. NPDC091412 TaxID=3366002 RepID=UPI00380C9C6F
MTDRIPLDNLTSDQLDTLYADLDRYEEVVGELNETNIELAQRAGRAEAAVARVRKATTRSFMAGPNAVDVVRVTDIHTALTEPKSQPPAEHIRGRANTEDCPTCSASPSPPPYPFICPGYSKPDQPTEAEQFAATIHDWQTTANRVREAIDTPADTCRPVDIDGDTIRVHGTSEMTEEDRAMFAEVVRAAKQRYASEHPEDAEQSEACEHCKHPADWHDPHEGCVGPNGIGGIGSGDCTCTRSPENALRPLDDEPAPPEPAPDEPTAPGPDPRQPAYDAVFAYLRRLGDRMPADPNHRNAIIWRAVHEALDATPVGRCVSSHCIEGDHVLEVKEAQQ